MPKKKSIAYKKQLLAASPEFNELVSSGKPTSIVHFHRKDDLKAVAGNQDNNLKSLAHAFGNNVLIKSHAGAVFVQGETEVIVEQVQKAIGSMKRAAQQELGLTEEFIAALPKRVAEQAHHKKTPIKSFVAARNFHQQQLIDSIQHSDITFAIGEAGTGKTWIAVALALEAYEAGKVQSIILVRPAVEAGGEKIGFLPGSMDEKMDPFMRPLYDVFAKKGYTQLDIQRMKDDGKLEIATLAHMRGRTLTGAFVIADEMQNATTDLMNMFITRLGQGSTMVITGDPTQNDLPVNPKTGVKVKSGLDWVAEIVEKDPEAFPIIKFDADDVVRHDKVARFIKLRNEYEAEVRRYAPNHSMVPG